MLRAAKLDDVARSGWAQTCLPWLASASVHCCLLIVLGLSLSLSQQSAGNSAAATGADQVRAVFMTRDSGDFYDDESSLDTFAGEPAGAAGSADVPPEQAAPQDAGTGDAGSESGGALDAGSPLASVLGTGPPIDFAGALPSASPLLGAGALEGGGVGNARQATTGSQGAKGLRGGSARTGVFGIESEGYKFVYVFDRSGSMGGHGGAPLAGAKAQLIASLEKLGQTHQFQIIFYNERPSVFNPSGTPGRLVFGNDSNKYLAQQFVNGIIADGATEHEDALAMALRMAPDVIFFLTDADEPRLNVRQLAHIARINKGTVINAIEFGFGAQEESENFLVRLARENGGKHVYVDISQLPQP